MYVFHLNYTFNLWCFHTPRLGGFYGKAPFSGSFFEKLKGLYDFAMLFTDKEGVFYEPLNSHRKPEKEERYSSVDAPLLLHVFLLANGIYLLFP